MRQKVDKSLAAALRKKFRQAGAKIPEDMKSRNAGAGKDVKTHLVRGNTIRPEDASRKNVPNSDLEEVTDI